MQLLDPARGPLELPIRSELFGGGRFQQHGRSLGETHTADVHVARLPFYPRIRDNLRVLHEAQHFIAQQEGAGRYVSPAGEWLLDNSHIVDAQLKEILDGLPRRYFRDLPVLSDAHLAGLPRVYAVAWAFVAHTDGAFDEHLLTTYLEAYNETRALTHGELWALPTTLRVVLVEDLRRLAERVACTKAARELAVLCGDQYEALGLAHLQRIHQALLQRRVAEPFLLHLAQRLADRVGPSAATARAWLAEALPDVAAAQNLQHAEQAADNLSVSNVITSLRLLGDADWRTLVGRVSVTMRLLEGSAAFRAERDDTQDDTLHAIERLSRRSGLTESEVARHVLDAMAQATDAQSPSAAPGYWWRGPGAAALRRSIGLAPSWPDRWRGLQGRLRLPLYLAAIVLGSVALAAAAHAGQMGPDVAWPWQLLGGLLLLAPASEATVAVLNRLIGESVRPRRLPRLAFDEGIPAEHRVLVVIPGMLADARGAQALAHQLELHYLANRERHAQFALLSDWSDADTEHTAGDAAVLAAAREAIEALERRYPSGDPTPRFLLLHRERRWSDTERRWIGWERKRGKLEQLIARMATGEGDAFLDLGALSAIAPATPYVVTLDSDTTLPPGRLRQLVGVAAHPNNLPRLDASGRRTASGYAILQPRVATPLPALRERTAYQWLFAGQCGVDPYSAASSETYQDVFGEGTFIGKGLLHVKAAHATLGNRLPEGSVLSHDLLEGSLARCASVSDISLLEDAPIHPDVAASRVHRWTRGDWQLLPLLLRPRRYAMRAINRWKMIDNLRRSLVAPASLLLLVLALAGEHLDPRDALLLVLAGFGAGPLLGALAGMAPSRDEIAMRYFYAQASADLLRAVGIAVWNLLMLMSQALLLGDALLRALWRMAASRRHLLQWTTSAAAQAAARSTFGALLRQHARTSLAALGLWALLIAAGTREPLLASALCLAWAATPLWVWAASQPRSIGTPAEPLARLDRDYLYGVARDTWRLFERWVGPADHGLPPDNVQILPHVLVAHRTSPTNIGLALLATACAREFGWIGTSTMLSRCEAAVATLQQLERYRGHFLNWYDTQTLAVLPPAYVSTVDSGNLCGHLAALAQAALELAEAPLDRDAMREALRRSRERWRAASKAGPDRLAKSPALARLIELDEPLTALQADPAAFERALREADAELQPLLPADTAAPAGSGEAAVREHESILQLLQDHLAVLHSALLESEADAAALATRLHALAQACQRLALEAEFGFLYDPKRQLFHIGFRTAEQQLDRSYYDLLASEARFASLWAIAKGEVPPEHWSALGRPAYAVGTCAALRSWSGSMFEYLMPTLVLDEPVGSVLQNAGVAAVVEQRAYGVECGLPWGVSESAYGVADHTLAYQYGPQGVPRLALRRTPPDERVVACYATVLAAQLEPAAAAANLRRLEGLEARDRLGFIEALDFSPERQGGPEPGVRVATFMAHHQGMSLLALAGVLIQAPARRWCMADPRLQAVLPLLHERPPREISVLLEPPPRPAVRERRAGITLNREVSPVGDALPPTQLLSNGRYSVAIRANGAGWTRFDQAYISRWRDDALRDAQGHFFYLRRQGQNEWLSLTHHPAPDPAARYAARFHTDRVELDADWPDLQTRCTVWVSAEDDVELRTISLRNRSDEPLELELASCFEVSLNDARADESHPAFANMFVRAQWDDADQALYLERKPRLATERGLHAVHFIAIAPSGAADVRVQTDRARWLGRNRDASRPLGSFEPAGAAGPGAVEQITGLDPVAAIGVRLSLPPHAKLELTFATAAALDPEPLPLFVDKYRQRLTIERASLMSATWTRIRLREMRIGADEYASLQTLATTLALVLSRPPAEPPPTASDRRLLWRFGISGDRPILVARASAAQGEPLLHSLAQALRLWSWSGLGCDVVVVNAEPASYLMPLQQSLLALQQRYDRETDGSMPAARRCGLFVLQAQELSADEDSTLRALARATLQADGRPLAYHVDELQAWHQAARTARGAIPAKVVPAVRGPASDGAAPQGRFDAASHEFHFEAGPGKRPARPWVNLLANPQFGAQISEAGGGYTWGGNSRMNQLTPWSNDPVSDPAGEHFLLQDLSTGALWNVAPAGLGGSASGYEVRHGQGYTSIVHRHDDLAVDALWCVDPELPVKQVRLRLANRGRRRMRLRAVTVVEWIIGAARADRQSVVTAAPRGLAAGTLLTATQLERQAGYGQATGFVTARNSGGTNEWTCDRRELFDDGGRLCIPQRLGAASGAGLDPCAALTATLVLAPGAVVDHTVWIGHAENPTAALTLAQKVLGLDPETRQQASRAHWDALLEKVSVATPDPLFDAMVNRWLLYQTVACRLWARTAFYQAGGAYGFRDQLQDAMALALPAPRWLRAQIVLSASRQFPEGDVQHWWHAPTGAGVRTHFSDDLLWLPLATAHYLAATEDGTVLDEEVPFLEGAPIPAGQEDAYYTPGISALHASVYEHCARTIDRSLAVGTHGLPLMGVGDWNDGMNRVGNEGRGESVWLAWFLCRVVHDFAPIARTRGDVERADRWQAAARGWRAAATGAGWDGEWFKRAFFDDGSPLGSRLNTECRIDLIAQCWSVLADAAPREMQVRALEAAEQHLVDRESGLIRLLDPPLQHAQPSAGYIQAYPPGVRENGGQYSHAGTWLVIAHARLGHADAAYRCFTWLSPAHRAADAQQGPAYAIEPYAMAGDVYTQPPYRGRGGWSWYTGSAAWMHRAAIESICGLSLSGRNARLDPRLPSHWPSITLTLRLEDGTHEFLILRADSAAASAPSQRPGAVGVAAGVAFPLSPGGGSYVLRLPSVASEILNRLASSAPRPAAQRSSDGA